MCCGKSRMGISQTRTPFPATRDRQAAAIPAPRQAAAMPAPRQRSAVAYFQYSGKTAMTVIGPVSGLQYRFAYPGSRLPVDIRDRAAVAAVPGLMQVHGL